MEKDAKIYVAGHRGLVGSAIMMELKKRGYTNLIVRSSKELDLRNQIETERFFSTEKPEYVFLAAARVGGIHANNTMPAVFLYDNLMIQANVIENAYKYNTKKLMFLGSSCVYPRLSPQPMKEEYLLDGKLEPTNEGYAIAKIAGIRLCEYYKKQYGCNFISVMPTNIYGENDDFNIETSHVIPALINRFHNAKINNDKEVVLWGTGKPRREFLHVSDLADACLFLMENYNENEHINIGTGKDVEINELALLIKKVIGYEGEIKNDHTKPDGMPRKLLDVTKLESYGWKYKIDLEEGLRRTYRWYLSNSDQV